MKLESRLPKQSFWLYLGPVLNVLTLLLVFFLLGSNFVVQSGVKVMLPEGSSRLPGFDRAHIITVGTGTEPEPGKNSRAYPWPYFFDGEPATMEVLKQKLIKAKRNGPKVIVHADSLAPFGRVLDAGNLALSLGFEVAFATQPPAASNP